MSEERLRPKKLMRWRFYLSRNETVSNENCNWAETNHGSATKKGKGGNKMKNGLTKLHYLSLGLLLVGVAGCGANKVGNTDATSPSGAISAKLAWNSSKSAARALAAVPGGIDHLKFTVTGSGANGALPVVTTTAPASNTQGNVGGVYPGTVAVAVKAFADQKETTLAYEGYAINVTVNPNATTNVGTINMTPPVVKADEVSCLACHENTLDATGQNIVANYKGEGSSHYTTTGLVLDSANPSGTVPGCAGCHGKSHNTPDPSAIGSTQVVGSTATGINSTRCFDCHNVGQVKAQVASAHDSYYLANTTACASCHQNHNSKAGDMERVSWATSRHGATDFAHMVGGTSLGCATRCHNAKGFIAAVNNPSKVVQGTVLPAPQMITCDACHTNAPLGILRSLPGTKATAFATYTTSTKGYPFAPNNKLNLAKKPYYPDVAGSNLCIVCHSGTTEGSSATSPGMSDPYFANSTSAIRLKKTTTITQHNMPAAAVMYVKFGFTNLSTGAAGVPSAAYIASLTSDLDGGGITSTHRKFGTSAIVSDSHFSASNPAPATFQINGPCAVCHVTGSHSYKIDQAAITAVCNHCHTSENGNDITTIASFQANFLDPQQEVYRNAIALGVSIVNNKVAAYNATLTSTPNALGYSTTNPLKFLIGIDPMTSSQPGKLVFFKYMLDGTNGTSNTPYNADGTIWVSSPTTTSPVYAAPGTANANYLAANASSYPYYSSDWTNAAIALGYSQTAGDAGYTKFMGAISNLAFFAKDNGGFAHARTYVRRLIYDSVDFLDDGVLNMSVGTSAKALSLQSTIGGAVNPVYGLYKKGPVAYDGGAPYKGGLLDAATSESMTFLINWDGTGAWTTVERP